jgi:hypothetical protein
MACHLLLIEQVLEDRKTAGPPSEEEQAREEEHDQEFAALSNRAGDAHEEQTQEQVQEQEDKPITPSP